MTTKTKYIEAPEAVAFLTIIVLVFSLFQPIIPEKSEVKMLGTKVEIILKKQEAFSWPTLELQPDKKQTAQNGV